MTLRSPVILKSWKKIKNLYIKFLKYQQDFHRSTMLVNGLLIHYFKSLNIADNMSRIVGSWGSLDLCVIVHHFLKLGDHVIDNTFASDDMKYWVDKEESLLIFEYHSQPGKYNDGDPADPKYGVIPQSSDVGK